MNSRSRSTAATCSRSAARRPGQREQQRHRQLALAQVVQDGLADLRDAARVVEQVVDQLEGHAEAAAVLGQPLGGDEVAPRREVRRQPARGGEEVGGLAADDLEGLLPRDVDRAFLLDADDLALDHRERRVGEDLQDRQVALVERDAHGHRVEVVAEEHRQVVAPARVGRGAAAAQARLVDDVVVDERRRVDELDDGGVADVLVAVLVVEQLRREQQQGGPDPLAAALREVRADPVDRRDRGAEVEEQLLLDPRELVGDQVVGALRGAGCRAAASVIGSS